MKTLILITTILFIQKMHNPFYYSKQLLLASNDGMVKEKLKKCEISQMMDGGFKYVCNGGV